MIGKYKYVGNPEIEPVIDLLGWAKSTCCQAEDSGTSTTRPRHSVSLYLLILIQLILNVQIQEPRIRANTLITFIYKKFI